MGASLEEAAEDDAESGKSSELEAPKEGCYEIVGTLKDNEKSKPDFMKEIIKVRIFFPHHLLL